MKRRGVSFFDECKDCGTLPWEGVASLILHHCLVESDKQYMDIALEDTKLELKKHTSLLMSNGVAVVPSFCWGTRLLICNNALNTKRDDIFMVVSSMNQLSMVWLKVINYIGTTRMMLLNK